MKKAIPQKHGGKRPGAGRPATGKAPMMSLRMPPALTEAVDKWAFRQVDRPFRSEAIRRLVEAGLANTPSKGRSRSKKAASSDK